MTRIAVSHQVLRWAVHRSRRQPEDLNERFPDLPRWITGEKRPTLRQLETFARATFTPLGYFFLPEPPEEPLPIPYFRTADAEEPDQPSPELLETIQMMQQRQDWMREFLQDQGFEPLGYVGSAHLNQDSVHVARQMRNTLGLDGNWAALHSTWTDALRGLREAMDDVGVLVVVNGILGNNTHRKLDVTEFRGFVLVDRYAPLVFVNGADSKAAQMFTLAHELAHIFLGSSAIFDLRLMQPADDAVEQFCNQVAAEFLVPEDELRDFWPAVHNMPDPFQALARQFKVSEIVVARRALDLGLIQRQAFFEFYQAYMQRDRDTASTQQGGDFYRNQNLRVGKRFASTVIRAAREGKILYTEAYKLTGLYGRTFEEYAALLEGGR